MTDRHFKAAARAVARRPALASLLLGAVSADGFAPLDLWPITLACLAAWMWLVHGATSLKRALLCGWLFGLGQFAVAINWLQHPFAFQDAMPQWLGYGAVVLVAAYLALYGMVAAGCAWRFARPKPLAGSGTQPDAGYVLVFAAAWIVTEWLRGTIMTGFPWNPLAAIWVPLLPVAGIARLTGSYALSGLSIAAAGAILVACQGRWRFPAATLAVAAMLALVAPGLTPAAPRATPVDAPRARVIQPNLGEEERPTPNYAENNLRAIEALTGTPGPAPRLIVWPEGALRFFVEDGYPANAYWRGDAPSMRRRIAGAIGPADIVLAGGNGLKFDAAGNLIAVTNSVFVLNGMAQLRDRYDKAHLVPFGEYLPLRPILTAIGMSRLVPGDVDFARGAGRRSIDVPGFGKVGMDICYEIIFSGQVVDRAHRPRLIFNPSNDSWFGTWGPPQHLAQARLRAIEEGVPILRATPTGISAIIDADGRLLASVPAGTAGAIELPLPAPHPPTLFAMLGNWLAFLTTAALLMLAVAFRRTAR